MDFVATGSSAAVSDTGRMARRLRIIGFRPHWTEDALPPALLFIACASMALCMPPHNDTWWHLRLGKEMVQRGGILLTEQLSHTAHGMPLFHNHEWLAQLLFYAAYAAGGPLFLAAICATCVVGGIALAWQLCEGSADARFGWLMVLVIGTAMGWAIRPQALSIPLFVLALRLATSRHDKWLPVLCLVWSNLHGVAITAVIVAGCAALDAITTERQHAGRKIAVLLSCVAAPLFTPVGWHYWWRTFEVVRMVKQLGIQEYHSSFHPAMLPFWACVIAFAVLLGRSDRRWLATQRTRVLVLVACVFGVASMLSVRNIPLFILAAVPAMSRLFPTGREHADTRRLSAASSRVMFGVALAAVGLVSYAWRNDGAGLGWRPVSPAAIAAIRRCDGPMFNGFADGGPLAWFVPERKVFVDSRGAEAYPWPLLLASRQADLHGEYRRAFDQARIGCAVVSAHSIMARALQTDPDMQAIYADRQWHVFRRVR